jgi:hypothetical protein
MRVIVTVTFACAMLLGAFSVFAHLVVYIGLRRRRVDIQSWRSGMPGYLYRLCEQLPPSTANARLVRLARWSDIAFFGAFVGAIITGPLIAQATR